MTHGNELGLLQQQIRACIRCREHRLIHQHADGRWAYPVLQPVPLRHVQVLAVGEAPNFDDTFDPRKGYLTYGPETDPTGQFAYHLLHEIVGIPNAQLLLSNCVLCLPAKRGRNFPVTAKQSELCLPWLRQVILATQPRFIVSFGAQALAALGHLERHALSLKTSAGRLHPWLGRQLLPLYHPGRLGRANRPADLQRADVAPLRNALGI